MPKRPPPPARQARPVSSANKMPLRADSRARAACLSARLRARAKRLCARFGAQAECLSARSRGKAVDPAAVAGHSLLFRRRAHHGSSPHTHPTLFFEWVLKCYGSDEGRWSERHLRAERCIDDGRLRLRASLGRRERRRRPRAASDGAQWGRRQRTSAHVSARQHALARVSTRQHRSAHGRRPRAANGGAQ